VTATRERIVRSVSTTRLTVCSSPNFNKPTKFWFRIKYERFAIPC
jgi:hypothetical protein